MNTLKLILADNSEIELSEFSLPMHAVVMCNSNDEVLALWKRMTNENLTHVAIKSKDQIVLSYRYAGLTGVQAIDNYDGTYTAHFYLEGEQVVGSEEDEAYIAAAKILMGEEA